MPLIACTSHHLEGKQRGTCADVLMAGVSTRWRSTASLDDLTASALGVLGLRGGSGGRDNASAAAAAAQYRYPIGNHGRWTARCAPPQCACAG